MKDVIKVDDLIPQLTGKIEKEIMVHSHVILAFNSYEASLSILKQATWDTRHKILEVQFKLSPATVVKDITLSDLLSHPILYITLAWRRYRGARTSYQTLALLYLEITLGYE